MVSFTVAYSGLKRTVSRVEEEEEEGVDMGFISEQLYNCMLYSSIGRFLLLSAVPVRGHHSGSSVSITSCPLHLPLLHLHVFPHHINKPPLWLPSFPLVWHL